MNSCDTYRYGAATAMPKLALVYGLMLAALVAAVAFSRAATAAAGQRHTAMEQPLLVALSVASFIAIGGLSAIAQTVTESGRPQAFAGRAVPESPRRDPILGLRAWRAVAHGDSVILQSWHARHAVWPSGREMTAEPASLGIHAFKSAADLLAYLGPHIDGRRTVIGTVALWGTVIEYEAGWTAEKAYPVEVHAADADIAARVRRVYGCETSFAPDGLTRAAVALEAKLDPA